MTVGPRLRTFALTVHIAVSVGWIGAVAAYLALDVTVATSQNAQTLRAAYVAMELITRSVIVPLALASLLTGLVMAVGTKWGLFRHYWVLISLVLTTVATFVLLVETQVIGALADIAADPATSSDDLRALPNTLVHSVGGTIVLVVIQVLNVYKPRGMTRYGRRKQREQRPVRATAAALTLVTLIAGCGDGQAEVTARQSHVAALGERVMPFDLDATTHRFEPVDDGLVQTVVADDPGDADQIALIREHLASEAERFTAGDYSDPASIHGEDMPGLAELEEGAQVIAVTYEPTTDGGRINYTTTDNALVDALHRWADAQVSDHGPHAEGASR